MTIGADSFDLGGEGINDELVDAVASDASNSLCVVGEVVGQPNSGLFCHDIMISRCKVRTVAVPGAHTAGSRVGGGVWRVGITECLRNRRRRSVRDRAQLADMRDGRPFSRGATADPEASWMRLDRPRTYRIARRGFVRHTPTLNRHVETTRQAERVQQRPPRRRPLAAFPEAFPRPSSPSIQRKPVQRAQGWSKASFVGRPIAGFTRMAPPSPHSAEFGTDDGSAVVVQDDAWL